MRRQPNFVFVGAKVEAHVALRDKARLIFSGLVDQGISWHAARTLLCDRHRD